MYNVFGVEWLSPFDGILYVERMDFFLCECDSMFILIIIFCWSICVQNVPEHVMTNQFKELFFSFLIIGMKKKKNDGGNREETTPEKKKKY